MTALDRMIRVLLALGVIAGTDGSAGDRRGTREDRELMIRPMIVGGNDAHREKYPYYIQYGTCGATLVHGDIALTAAHCTQPDTKRLLVGANRRYYAGDEAVFTTIKKDKNDRNIRVQHEKYDSSTKEFDVAILKLNAWMDPKVFPPVRLGSASSKPTTNQKVRAVGMGQLAYGGKYADTLQEVELYVNSSSVCKERYKNSNGVNQFNPNNMICAAAYGKDSCTGDSGGPLLDMGGNQVGIATHGKGGCANERYPGVYADIGSVREWIDRKICELSDQPPTRCDTGGQLPKFDESKNRIRLDLKLDEFPQDAGWRLWRDRGGEQTLAELKYQSLNGNIARTLSSHYLTLPDNGEYQLTMRDAWGDGLTFVTSDDRNMGYYKVTSIDVEKEGGKAKRYIETEIFAYDKPFRRTNIKFPVGNRRRLRGHGVSAIHSE